jgi:quercetin dioxygenase-like cupin family protein
MMPKDSVTHYNWEQMPKEQVSKMLDRRLITGERLMLAHVYLKKGCIVPKHSHHNEQITYILEGELKFWIGEDEEQVVHVKPGEVLHIPPHVPHKAEALEDTVDVDIFDPPREDWLNKTDNYLR